MAYRIKEIMFTEKEIQDKVLELAKEISEDYKSKEPIFVGILKGSFVFMADLIKNVENDNLRVDFMRASSYGNKTKSDGKVNIKLDMEFDPKGEDILIIEDIIDSGYTLKCLHEYLLNKGAKSVKIATLLNKSERRVVDIKVDYVGFEIPDKFIIGYGLDYNENLRNLPYIGVLDETCLTEEE